MANPDYQSLIDAETWAFIRASGADDTASLPIAEQRRIYDKMCRAFFRGYPAGITARDETVAGVRCRIYPGVGPTVVYLHGGGFVVGGLESHDDICAEIRARTGLTVVAPDYRLSPEHLHPAAFEDALAVIRATSARGPVVVAGDSAGGNLAAATAGALRATPERILGQVLIYPGLGGAPDTASAQEHAEAPMLTARDVAFYAAIRHGGRAPFGDPTSAPLQDADFSGLPPTVAFSAQCDPLADDAQIYAARVTAAGGLAHWILEPGLVHGYLRARSSVARAAASFTRICSTLSALARSEWPYGTPS